MRSSKEVTKTPRGGQRLKVEIRGGSLGNGDPHWQGIDPAHFCVLEPNRIAQIIDGHIEGVVTPKQLVATTNVGTPNTPFAIAHSVFLRNVCLTAGSFNAASRVWKPERLGKVCQHNRVRHVTSVHETTKSNAV